MIMSFFTRENMPFLALGLALVAVLVTMYKDMRSLKSAVASVSSDVALLKKSPPQSSPPSPPQPTQKPKTITAALPSSPIESSPVESPRSPR